MSAETHNIETSYCIEKDEKEEDRSHARCATHVTRGPIECKSGCNNRGSTRLRNSRGPDVRKCCARRPACPQRAGSLVARTALHPPMCLVCCRVQVVLVLGVAYKRRGLGTDVALPARVSATGTGGGGSLVVDVQLVADIAPQLVFAGVVLALSVLKGGELGLALI